MSIKNLTKAIFVLIVSCVALATIQGAMAQTATKRLTNISVAGMVNGCLPYNKVSNVAVSWTPSSYDSKDWYRVEVKCDPSTANLTSSAGATKYDYLFGLSSNIVFPATAAPGNYCKVWAYINFIPGGTGAYQTGGAINTAAIPICKETTPVEELKNYAYCYNSTCKTLSKVKPIIAQTLWSTMGISKYWEGSTCQQSCVVASLPYSYCSTANKCLSLDVPGDTADVAAYFGKYGITKYWAGASKDCNGLKDAACAPKVYSQCISGKCQLVSSCSGDNCWENNNCGGNICFGSAPSGTKFYTCDPVSGWKETPNNGASYTDYSNCVQRNFYNQSKCLSADKQSSCQKWEFCSNSVCQKPSGYSTYDDCTWNQLGECYAAGSNCNEKCSGGQTAVKYSKCNSQNKCEATSVACSGEKCWQGSSDCNGQGDNACSSVVTSEKKYFSFCNTSQKCDYKYATESQMQELYSSYWQGFGCDGQWDKACSTIGGSSANYAQCTTNIYGEKSCTPVTSCVGKTNCWEASVCSQNCISNNPTLYYCPKNSTTKKCIPTTAYKDYMVCANALGVNCYDLQFASDCDQACGYTQAATYYCERTKYSVPTCELCKAGQTGCTSQAVCQQNCKAANKTLWYCPKGANVCKTTSSYSDYFACTDKMGLAGYLKEGTGCRDTQIECNQECGGESSETEGEFWYACVGKDNCANVTPSECKGQGGTKTCYKNDGTCGNKTAPCANYTEIFWACPNGPSDKNSKGQKCVSVTVSDISVCETKYSNSTLYPYFGGCFSGSTAQNDCNASCYQTVWYSKCVSQKCQAFEGTYTGAAGTFDGQDCGGLGDEACKPKYYSRCSGNVCQKLIGIYSGATGTFDNENCDGRGNEACTPKTYYYCPKTGKTCLPTKHLNIETCDSKLTSYFNPQYPQCYEYQDGCNLDCSGNASQQAYYSQCVSGICQKIQGTYSGVAGTFNNTDCNGLGNSACTTAPTAACAQIETGANVTPNSDCTMAQIELNLRPMDQNGDLATCNNVKASTKLNIGQGIAFNKNLIGTVKPATTLSGGTLNWNLGTISAPVKLLFEIKDLQKNMAGKKITSAPGAVSFTAGASPIPVINGPESCGSQEEEATQMEELVGCQTKKFKIPVSCTSLEASNGYCTNLVLDLELFSGARLQKADAPVFTETSTNKFSAVLSELNGMKIGEKKFVEISLIFNQGSNGKSIPLFQYRIRANSQQPWSREGYNSIQEAKGYIDFLYDQTGTSYNQCLIDQSATKICYRGVYINLTLDPVTGNKIWTDLIGTFSSPTSKSFTKISGVIDSCCGNGKLDTEKGETCSTCPTEPECKIAAKCLKLNEFGSASEFQNGTKQCCEGLFASQYLTGQKDPKGNCIGVSLPLWVCSYCGDGACNNGENECSCASDCKKTEEITTPEESIDVIKEAIPGDDCNSFEIKLGIFCSSTPTFASAPKKKPIDLTLAIDKSGSTILDEKSKKSMKTLEEEKAEAIKLIDKLDPSTDRVAVLAYDHNTEKVVSQLTNDFDMVKNKIRAITAKSDGGTDIAEALDESHNIMKNQARSEAEKHIVLLSDGAPTYAFDEKCWTGIKDSWPTKDTNCTREAKNQADQITSDPMKITLHTVGINFAEIGKDYPASVSFLRNFMKEMATNPNYYHESLNDVDFARKMENVFTSIDAETNDEYCENVSVVDTLPTGVEYVGVLENTPAPQKIGKDLRWNLGKLSEPKYLRIAARFSNEAAKSNPVDVYPNSGVLFGKAPKQKFSSFPETYIEMPECANSEITEENCYRGALINKNNSCVDQPYYTKNIILDNSQIGFANLSDLKKYIDGFLDKIVPLMNSQGNSVDGKKKGYIYEKSLTGEYGCYHLVEGESDFDFESMYFTSPNCQEFIDQKVKNSLAGKVDYIYFSDGQTLSSGRPAKELTNKTCYATKEACISANMKQGNEAMSSIFSYDQTNNAFNQCIYK